MLASFLWIFIIFWASGISWVDGGTFSTKSQIIPSGHETHKEFSKHEPPQEAFMSTPELITHHGYPVEEHQVVTEDGYRLTVFRIPYGKTKRIGPAKRKPEPVIIYHGFLQSSDDWLLLPNPEDNLPYVFPPTTTNLAFASTVFSFYLHGNFKAPSFVKLVHSLNLQ